MMIIIVAVIILQVTLIVTIVVACSSQTAISHPLLSNYRSCKVADAERSMHSPLSGSQGIPIAPSRTSARHGNSLTIRLLEAVFDLIALEQVIA